MFQMTIIVIPLVIPNLEHEQDLSDAFSLE